MASEPSKHTTEYVILEQAVYAAGDGEANDNGFVVRGQVGARSAQDAVRIWATDRAPKGGTFYAVPARSWKPITVAVETQTKLKLS